MACCTHNRNAIRILASLTAIFAVGLAGVCRADDALQQQAESALLQRLHAAYPRATRFAIDPLPTEWRASAWLERAHVAHPTVLVTRVGSRSAVWVGTSPESGVPRGAMLWFQVAGYAPAVVATQLLASGTALQAGDGEMANRDIVAADCQPLSDPAQLAGMRATRLVLRGDVLCAGAVEPLPPVARGERVTARFAAHGVSITTQAVAQGDGVIGAPVAVRNIGGGPVYSATVTGKAEVSVSD